MPAPQSQRWSLRPTLDFDGDKFDTSITGDKLDSIVRGMVRTVCAIYSIRLALFINGIMSAKRMREVQPAVLIGESSSQLQCIH